MPTKVAENKLLGSILLAACSLALLFNAKVFSGTVRLYEPGILMVMAAVVILLFAIHLARRAFVKG